MIQLIFVHGIGASPHRSAMEPAWTESLTLGMTRSGHSEIAEQVRKGKSLRPPRMVHYGPLYAAPGAQGPVKEGFGDDALLLHDLLSEMVDDLLDGASDPADLRILATAKAQLEPTGTPQGPGNIVRTSINAASTLMSLGGIRRSGQWVSARMMIGDLRQVTRYLERGEVDQFGDSLDARIRSCFAQEVGAEPAIIIAHSLGSVVAVESLHCQNHDVPLLVTLGSPLGMRTVVMPRLRPQPPRTPEGVDAWLNFWDPNDVIVARRNLVKDFGANDRGVYPKSERVDSPGLWTHAARKYLEQPAIAGRIAEVIQRYTIAS